MTQAAAVLLARDLCGQWFTWRCGNGKPFNSQSETESKLAFVQRWLDARPAADLLDAATYRDFATFITARGSSTAATAAYVASVLRPTVLWALSPQQGRLTGESPFGHYGVTVAAGRERTRVLSPEEITSIRSALVACPHPDAPRTRDFVEAMLALGTRPVELALATVGHVDYTEHVLTIPGAHAKSGKARALPYDPAGPVATIVNAVRLKGPGHYLFARVQPSTQTSDPTALGRSIVQGMRTAWESTIIAAYGGRVTVATRKTADERQIYQEADCVLRDLRRTAASRWDSYGLPWHQRERMLGHALGMSARYSIQDVRRLARDLDRHVWSVERASASRLAVAG